MSNAGVENLIPIINDLHDISTSVGEGLNFDLPLIAVVGSQSAGKSSVLENFVGKDFLPRGSGIVTRRPLILKLIHSEKEYGIFFHSGTRKYSSYDEIRKEIEAETERSNPGKSVSNNPINLSIYSPSVIDLTLVDLPGMTKVAVGNQNKDISNIIRNMLLEFITKDNCLILAVSPANVDLANSDALNIAAEVDPTGIRTIGVITKLDLMDAGTDAYDVLTNKVIPLRRGYVGIVNRSQQDIDGNKDIMAAQKAEAEYFLKHPKYRAIASQCGTLFLQRLLSEQLTNHIRGTLPKMLRNIQEKNIMLATELRELDESDVSSPERRVNFISTAINNIQTKFHQTMYGDADIENIEYSFGYKIKGYLGHRLSYELNKAALDIGFSDKQIQIAISNSNGISPALFLSPSVIENPIGIIITHLKKPINFIINLVLTDIKSVIQEVTEYLNNYPGFCEYLQNLILQKLTTQEEALLKYASVIIDAECGYIFTANKKFKIMTDPKRDQTKKKKKTNETNNHSIEKIKSGYCQIYNIKSLRKKDYYFSLTNLSLTVYSHMDMQNIKLVIPIEVLMILDENDIGLWIATSDDSCIWKDESSLHMDVIKNTNDDIKDWKAALITAGGKLEDKKIESVESNDDDDEKVIHSATTYRTENLVRVDLDEIFVEEYTDILMIKTLLRTYTDIVVNNMCDLIPKIIVEFLIRQVERFIKNYLMAQILTKGDLTTLFNIKRETMYRIEETKKFYEATEKSIHIIKRIINTTRNTPVPPSIRQEQREPEISIKSSRMHKKPNRKSVIDNNEPKISNEHTEQVQDSPEKKTLKPDNAKQSEINKSIVSELKNDLMNNEMKPPKPKPIDSRINKLKTNEQNKINSNPFISENRMPKSRVSHPPKNQGQLAIQVCIFKIEKLIRNQKHLALSIRVAFVILNIMEKLKMNFILTEIGIWLLNAVPTLQYCSPCSVIQPDKAVRVTRPIRPAPSPVSSYDKAPPPIPDQ
ncbi:hypothetical protein A3Q56_02381 [Intoshia linei]|uniref:dynamin GTPase n=1 Tax=Intoshia linei TaxID=1819745 RepID=A0A177B874_9BILA|nr:hypothetical protein A3Q56_02381 [Intoshia linei]